MHLALTCREVCILPDTKRALKTSRKDLTIKIVLLLRQVTLEGFVRLRAVERPGRRPQEYEHISRASDKVFRQPGKQNNSRVNWRSNIIMKNVIPIPK